jgi:hypothetical protein
MQRRFLILVFFAFAQVADAQYFETIRSDRPGQSNGPFSVGKNVFQIQSGIDFGGFRQQAASRNGSYAAPSAMLRYGLTRVADVNTSFGYRKDQYSAGDSSWSTNGLSLTAIGARINLYEGRGFAPAIGLQLTLKLPVLSLAYNPAYIAPDILLIVNERISDRISLLTNFGVNYNGNNAVPRGVYVANLSYSFSSRWGAFIETYGNITSREFENRWDAGLAFFVNNNLQLDAYGGAGTNSGTIDYFTSIGMSWRCKTSAGRHGNKSN